MNQQWKDITRHPKTTEGKAPQTASSDPSQKLLAVSRQVGQAVEFLLSHLPGLAHLHKFTLEEGDLTDETLSIFPNRHLPRDILHLPHLSRLRL
jgi:hypothetical protein